MKKFLSLCVLLCINFVLVRAQAPTTPSTNMTFNSLDGNSYRANWTNGNGARRIVVMRQGAAVTAVPVNGVDYNPNNTFGSGDVLAPGQFVVLDGTNNFVDVSGLQPGTTYHLAVFEYNGTASATQYLVSPFLAGSQATLTAPVTPASAPTITNITGSSMTVNWTNGSGSRRIVVGRAGGPVNANPTDLTIYSASTIFGNASTQLGTGNYVVFSGTANNVIVTGLQPSTTYHFSIFEQNGSSGPVYLVPGTTVNAVTAPRPSIAAINPVFNSIEGNSMRFNWTNGNGSRRIVIARAGSAVTAVPADGIDYNASNIFGSGDDLGGNQYVVFDGTNTFVDISNLLHTTTYHFRVFEYDGSGATTAYLTSSFLASSQPTLSAPTIQASNINFTNVSGSTVTINWTNGNGSKRIVVGRAGGPVNADPTQLVNYSSSTSFGSPSTQLGVGNYVVFNQTTGNSVVITNLAINTTYHFSIYEANGSGGPVYLIPGLNGSVTTPAAPTVPASAMNFNSLDGGSFRANWTNGNGARRIVIARQGAAVTAVPADGIDYNSSSVFGSGDDLGGNQYVVFDGTSTFVDMSNFLAATTYHFRVYEYNGTGATTSYLTSSFASGSQATLGPPSTQVSGINFTTVGASNLRINWINGNGSGRLVVMRQGSAVNADPVNLIQYTPNTVFGSGAQIGTGNFVIVRTTGATNTTLVTNLIPNTTYHVAIYEHSGSGTPVYLTPAAVANVTTAAEPTIPASAMTFNSLEGNSLRVNWTNGNGARRLVVGRAGSAVTAAPVNGIDYNPNNIFGSGSNLGSNQYVLFDGTNTFVDVSNLLPNTIYHFAVFEYDVTGPDTVYLTSSFLAGSQSTLITPTVQASNVSFSSVAGTSVTVGWTIGNGSARQVVARQGSAVNANPVDLTSYSPSTIFGSGGQVGTGNYSIYSQNGSSTGVTGLATGTTYHFAVYEYNGSGGRVYLVPGATGSVTTLGPPQVQAINISASGITTNTLQLTWTNGSGNRRLVLMRQGAAVNAAPVDNGTYTANSAFGAGTQLGTGNYVVFNATGNVVTVTGLLQNTTYHFAVYEFNSFGASSQFLLTNPAIGSAMTTGALPLTWLSFTGKNGKNRIELKWTTTAERQTSHFEVQRNGLNDQNNFHAVGIVHASGGTNSVNDYSFIDESPLPGMNYYRVKQYDQDNRFSYSMIIAIKYEPQGLIKRFLNPVDERGVFVELTAFDPNMNTKNEWLLYNLNGAVVARDIITSSVIYGNTLHVPAGMYILEVRANGKRERLKIIKH